MQLEIFSFVYYVYGWIKVPEFNSGWYLCIAIEHTVIWVNNFLHTFDNKRGFLKVETIIFSLQLVASWFHFNNAQMHIISNIL